MAPLGPEEEGAGRQNRADGESDRDQRSDPQPEAQHEPDQGQTRTQLGQLIKRIVVGIVVTALVAVGAYKTLSQKRSPSGAKEATPIGPPPIPGLGEITVTCSPTLQTARGNVFSAAWDIPGAPSEAKQAFDAVRGELETLVSKASPGFHIRIGARGRDGSTGVGVGGAEAGGGSASAPIDWKQSTNTGSSDVGIDEIVASVKEIRAEPQIDVSAFASDARGAGDLVAFLNGTDDSDPEVARRKAAGREEPLGVEIFELGSAFLSEGAKGGIDTQAARSYGRFVAEAARAMRSRSPTPLKILASLPGSVQGTLPASLPGSPPGSLAAGPAAGSSSPTSVKTLAQLIDETKDSVDGYAVSYVPSSQPPYSGNASALEALLTEIRRLVDERSGGKNMLVTLAPWDMSAFGDASGPSWAPALTASAGWVTAARSGIAMAYYPGIPSDRSDKRGYTYWPGADPENPSPAYAMALELADALPRELVDTELTQVAEPEEENDEDEDKAGESTPRPARPAASPAASKDDLVAQCGRKEGMRTLVLLNLSGSAAVVNIKVGFAVGANMTRTVFVAPLESARVERATTEFVGRDWFGDSLPPFSVTIWQFPRQAE